MAGELLFPILPCRELDESTAFYEVLGFEVTYRQKRPNPYAVVCRDDIQIHLAGVEGFEPAHSYGSVIIVVPDTDEEGERTTGLARVLENAARLGDAKGDDAAALGIIDAGLVRFPDAPAIERVRALLYRAELCTRRGEHGQASASLAEAAVIELDPADGDAVAGELAHAAELVAQPNGGPRG